MRKLLLFFPFIIIIIGCNHSNINFKINNNDITQIKYEGTIIMPNDYKIITDYINNIALIEDKNIKIKQFDSNLTITTNENIYNFYLLNNNRLLYGKADSLFFSNNINNVGNLKSLLNNLKNIYTKNNFYTISYISQYIPIEEDLFIQLDIDNNLIMLNSEIDIFNFKIYSIKNNNDQYIDTKLLYSINKILSNKKIVIRKTINSIPNIRISFETPYNQVVSIIPIYDSNINKVIFNSNFKTK